MALEKFVTAKVCNGMFVQRVFAQRQGIPID
jgi:hypothetical protein